MLAAAIENDDWFVDDEPRAMAGSGERTGGRGVMRDDTLHSESSAPLVSSEKDSDALSLQRTEKQDNVAIAVGPTLGSSGARPVRAASQRGAEIPRVDAGTVLGGIYRVIGRIGEGAMGVILLAEDEHLERNVAIKLLRPEQTDNLMMQGRLLGEARAMARVHHPNVMEIYAFGEHEGAPYFVMQYVEGVTLDVYARQKRGPPMDLDEALGIIDQMCLGVGAIHASGIAHRDLKPSNILVGDALHVVVADLGLAKKFVHNDGLQPSFSGTPAYTAPEVALLRRVDPALLPRADIYALGLIAYWLLVGRLPFEGKNIVEVFQHHAHSTPPKPSESNDELDPSFDEPLLRALVKEPEDRTESAEALRTGLLAARNDAPVSYAPMRVVIADDNSDFRRFLAEVLKVALPHAEIETTVDGEAALAAIQKRTTALGVFDLDMPGLDGIALTAAVRKLPQGGDFPIIVATGTGSATDWQMLHSLGASAFLVKPFDAGQLITLARGLVGLTSQVPPRSTRT